MKRIPSLVVPRPPTLTRHHHYTTDTSPFRFETGVALFAKKTPRPFPAPFLSQFSSSPHGPSREKIDGGDIRGLTNGDDAVYASDRFICANDGVGAWTARPRGHAGLWSRLILHFWAGNVEADAEQPDPVAHLQRAYEQTVQATSEPNWQGTTTASGAQLHFRRRGPDGGTGTGTVAPVVHVTNLCDGRVMVVRPRDRTVVYKTTEQWHWFDCPRQLGTNSPDTPRRHAVAEAVDVEPGDVVLAMTDGVIDNLWERDIVDVVAASVERWESWTSSSSSSKQQKHKQQQGGGGMQYAARELMEAARKVAFDPFARSPYMEHAIREGLANEQGELVCLESGFVGSRVSGKLDDISVVAALCVENPR